MVQVTVVGFPPARRGANPVHLVFEVLVKEAGLVPVTQFSKAAVVSAGGRVFATRVVAVTQTALLNLSAVKLIDNWLRIPAI